MSEQPMYEQTSLLDLPPAAGAGGTEPARRHTGGKRAKRTSKARMAQTPAAADAGPDGPQLVWVQPAALAPQPFSVRLSLDLDALEQLTESVRELGLLAPLLARRLADGALQLLSGERRLHAALTAGLESVPVLVIDAEDDRQAAIAQLVEALARADLGTLERAYAIERLRALQEASGQPDTVREIGRLVGWGRTTVSEYSRIGQQITPELVAAAEVDVRAVDMLSKDRLLNVIEALSFDDQAARLRNFVENPDAKVPPKRAPRGRPQEPFTFSTSQSGAIRLAVRRPVGELELDAALELRNQLAPLWEGLNARIEAARESDRSPRRRTRRVVAA